MQGKIHSLGNPKVEVSDGSERVVITTKHGQKFEIVLGKDTIQVTNITTPGSGILIKPSSNSSVLIKEQ